MIVALRFNSTKKQLTSVSAGEAMLWDFETRKLVRKISYETNVSSNAISSDGRLVLLGRQNRRSEDQSISILDMETGETTIHETGHKERVSAVAISPDGRTVITGGRQDKLLRIWQLGRAERKPE